MQEKSKSTTFHLITYTTFIVADGVQVLHEPLLALKQNTKNLSSSFLNLQAFDQKGRHQVSERLFEDAMFNREASVASFTCKHYSYYERGV